MTVLLVCSYSFKNGQTGDATQGRETAQALSSAGVNVVLVFVKYLPLRIYDSSDNELSTSEIGALVDSCDVVHLLPGTKPLCKFWRRFRQKPVAASSIFWGGIERVFIAFCNNKGLVSRAKSALKEIRNIFPLFMDYRGVGLFLPNSNAEGKCLMRCFRTDKAATYKVIPNGFIPPQFDVWSLPRSVRIPDEEYIVVPGAFARRKNQIGLIRAIRRWARDYMVVFMGGEYDRGYYSDCVSCANKNMMFLGYMSSKDAEYWKVLRHARVACLPSDCETPGIAMIEAAYAGARPVITKFGGTEEYYGEYGEYLNPCSSWSIVSALDRGWCRGRLDKAAASSFARFSWGLVAEKTLEAYKFAVQSC